MVAASDLRHFAIDVLQHQKKTKNNKKTIKDQILITCSPATAPKKGAC
jgi:hypothetical protein